MNRRAASIKAHKLWGTPGTAPKDRVGYVVIRRKNVVDRYEVGYYTRGGSAGQERNASGELLSNGYVVMGKGPSWEEAFERARRREEQLREEGLAP